MSSSLVSRQTSAGLPAAGFDAATTGPPWLADNDSTTPAGLLTCDDAQPESPCPLRKSGRTIVRGGVVEA